MNQSMPSVLPTGPTGNACWQCGAFVPNGVMHACGTAVVQPQYPPAPTPADERIAAALERIADALEAERP